LPFYKAGRVEEIPLDHIRFRCLEGKPLVLAHWAGRSFALEGLCPHRQNPLEGARRCGTISSIAPGIIFNTIIGRGRTISLKTFTRKI
jgi:hypothetical protein